MIGTLRLVMSMIVAAHHAGLWPWGIRWGLACVTGFFMVSGYGVSALADQYLKPVDGAAPGIWSFWRDRLLRIFPQYLFWLVATGFVVLVLDRRWLFQFGTPDWINTLCSITVLPTSFWMYIPSLRSFFILPQAWSLSIELMFYLLLPALVRWEKLGWILTLGSLIIFFLGSIGVLLPEDYFTYRLLPGELPFLMLGRALYRRDWPMQVVILGALHLNLLFVWLTGRLNEGYNLEILCGTLLPYMLLRLAVQTRPRSWDRALGNLAYGVYLSQLSLLAYLVKMPITMPERVVLVTAGSVLLGWVSFVLVEAPVNRYRRNLRRGAAGSGRISGLVGVGRILVRSKAGAAAGGSGRENLQVQSASLPPSRG